ncbi:gypsy type transposase [Tanacetum coccineum]
MTIFSKLMLLYAPISFPWYTSLSVVKDPVPSDDLVTIELLNLLDHHCTIIRRYPGMFLCLVGLSRSFNDLYMRPTLLTDNESDMGLLDYVKTADSFKVKNKERTLAEGEIPLNDETVNMIVAPSAEIIQIVEHTIVDELREHAGKKKRKVAFDALLMKKLRADGVVISEPVLTTSGKIPAALRRLELQSRPQGVGSSFVLHPTKEFVSSFVTPTPELDVPKDSGSTQDAAVQTHRTSTRIVVSFSSNHGDPGASLRAVPYVEVENFAADSARGVGTASVPMNNTKASTSAHDANSPIDEFIDSQTVDTSTAENIYVSEWNVTNGARVDSPALCCNLLDHITPPAYWPILLRLRYEHEIMTREKFERKFTDGVIVIQQRNADIIDLKAKLEKAERESVEVVGLRGRVSELETGLAAKSGEIADLSWRNSKLLADEAKLIEQSSSIQDAKARRFEEKSDELDARIADVRLDIDNDLYPRKVMSLVINMRIQEGLKARIEHGKFGRSDEVNDRSTPVNHRSTTDRPLVNGGGQRRSTMANDGQRWRITVGPPPDHRRNSDLVGSTTGRGRVGPGSGRVWERTCLRLFQLSPRDQASNWLERLPAGSITTWEDFTTRFLAQFFPSGRTAKLRNDILTFQ